VNWLQCVEETAVDKLKEGRKEEKEERKNGGRGLCGISVIKITLWQFDAGL
jgi:hypothetical protein